MVSMNLTLQHLIDLKHRLDSTYQPPRQLKIVESHACVARKQVKFPRSKKKRIRKKWSKNHKYYSDVLSSKFYRYQDMIICHPVMARQVRDKLERL